MPPNKTYPWREFSDLRLRRKDDTTNDPDWPALVRDPNTLVLTNGGIAAAASYTITVTPLSADVTVPDVVDATGVAADTTATATAIAAAINLEIADSLADFFHEAESDGAVVYVRVKDDAPRFTVSLTVPGGATFVQTPDDTWPITATTSNTRGDYADTPNSLAVGFVAVDSSGNPLPDDNSMTLSVEAVRVVERRFPGDVPNQPARQVGVSSSSTTAGHSIQDEYRVPFYGGRFTIRVFTLANTPTSFEALELYWREVKAPS